MGTLDFFFNMQGYISYALLAVIACIYGISEAAVTCPSGYNRNHGKCFKMISQKKSWADAQADCASKGGFLAEPVTKGESDFLSYLSQTSGALYDAVDVWYGGRDAASEGKWQWATYKTAISYFDWK